MFAAVHFLSIVLIAPFRSPPGSFHATDLACTSSTPSGLEHSPRWARMVRHEERARCVCFRDSSRWAVAQGYRVRQLISRVLSTLAVGRMQTIPPADMRWLECRWVHEHGTAEASALPSPHEGSGTAWQPASVPAHEWMGCGAAGN